MYIDPVPARRQIKSCIILDSCRGTA